MLTDRIFRAALLFSIICHGLLFYKWPPLKILSFPKPQKTIEVTYYSIKKAPVISEKVAVKEIIKKNPPMMHPKSAESGSRGSGIEKPAFNSKSTDKLPLKLQAIEENKKIGIAAADTGMLIVHDNKDLSEEPTYLNYYNAVRARIYTIANANKPYYSLEGNVKMHFTLSRDGNISGIEIIDEASCSNPILRRHALMSVKRAAPFPPFLPEMREDHLTLNLTISFEK